MPDTFRPVSEFSGAAFTWRRVRKPARRIELRCGPYLVATCAAAARAGARPHPAGA